MKKKIDALRCLGCGRIYKYNKKWRKCPKCGSVLQLTSAYPSQIILQRISEIAQLIREGVARLFAGGQMRW